MRVNAVIVTYNRLDILKLSVERLLSQTFVINRIVIVNNASNDGTQEYLREKSSENTSLDIINLDRNMGGAGGFYFGIKRAYELSCDYVWIMDDDTIATEKALSRLIDSLEVLKDRRIGFLTSNVLFKDDTPCLMNIPRTVYKWNDFIDKGIVEISHTSFVAMFIPSKVIQEVGLPIKDYFIWGDDGEYSTRILRAGYSGYLVGDSTVYHYMKENVGVDIFNTPKERIGRFFYFYRNNTITDRMRGPKRFIKRLLYHQYLVLKIIFSRTDHKLYKVCTVIKGTICGMFKRVSIDRVSVMKDPAL